jgi:S-adenosylmethionine synthetase
LDEDTEMGTASQKIAENVVLLAWARVSMALALPTIGLIFTLGWAYVDRQFEDTTKSLNAAQQMATTASEKASKVNDRLIAVETKQVQDAASSDKFQTATLTRLDRVQDSIVGLSNAVAALTATLQAMVTDQNRKPPP